MSEESTTPDLVERIRVALDAWNRGDLDATLKDFAADAIWEGVPLGLTFEGVAAIRTFLEEWRSVYDQYRAAAERLAESRG